MHPESMELMGEFIKMCVKENDTVLDVGSAMVNTGPRLMNLSYRTLLRNSNVEYTGLDIEAGRNVDLVVKDPYKWTEVKSDTYDIVISGQTLEHSEFFWLVFAEMARVLKPGGFMCLIVPKYHLTHRHPVDCWRFLPDGMKALAKYVGIKCIKADASHIADFLRPQRANLDCIGVFQK